MTHDPLAPYRRTTTAPAGGQAAGAGDEYTAFGTKDRVRRLQIHPANAPTHSVGYNLLLDVVYDRKKDTSFILVYTTLMVRVEGKNLRNLIFALQDDRADYIQAFDPSCWAKPADAQAAIIDSIEIKLIDHPDAGKAGNGRA